MPTVCSVISSPAEKIRPGYEHALVRSFISTSVVDISVFISLNIECIVQQANKKTGK
jgi:hypothetical protein